MKLAIIDDEKEICVSLEKMIQQKYKDFFTIYLYSSSIEYAQALEFGISFDIVLMDIVLSEKTGIDLVKDYSCIDSSSKVIYITGYIDYAPDIFSARPSGLLRKPISEEKLEEAINRVLAEISEENKDLLVIESKGNTYSVKPQNIMYVESNARKIIIYEKNHSLTVNMKLDDFVSMLNNSKVMFIRCHKSYLVNPSYIWDWRTDHIILLNDIQIPIARHKNPAAKEQFLTYLHLHT